MAEIGVIDNDVLIELFDRPLLKKLELEIVSWLQLRFFQVWIPKYIIEEFSITPAKRKRLTKLLAKYSDVFRECPITVSASERRIHLSVIDEGEADGILQSYKAPGYGNYSKLNFTFISNDTDALDYAEAKGVKILRYSEIKFFLNEKGIIL
jgi:hypothetical protein